MKKRVFVILMAFAMVFSMLPAAAIAVEGEGAPVEVATCDALVAALSSGGEIRLTADITVDTAITVPDGTTIDLNGQTLYVNVENSYYNDATIKNGAIVLGKDDVHVCDGYFLVNEGKTLVLNGVNMSSSSEGIKGYAVFHLKTGANLDLIDSALSISDNEYTSGYIVYAGESTATLDVTGTTITGSNTNGVVHATTVIDDSTFTLTDAVEHGINRSALTIKGSDVTISGGTGRGITAQHGDLVIQGDSVVSITDMGEATIELRGDKGLTVAETATVTVDAAVNNTTSGTISGTVHVGAVTPAYTAANSFWGKGKSNFTESFVIELYEGDTRIASASLNNVGGIIDGDGYVTWHINFGENNDEDWTVEWAEGYPRYDMDPDTVKLIADGIQVAANDVQFNDPDNLNKIVALAEGFTGGVVAYTSLAEAMGSFNGRKVNVLRDVSEDIEEMSGVTLTTNVEGGVTITNTLDDYIYTMDSTIGKGVTVVTSAMFFQGGENNIYGRLEVDNDQFGTGAVYYQAYDAIVNVKDGGSVDVEGSVIFRYNEDEGALNIYGDEDDSTVEFACDYYIGAYSGTFYAEDANIETGYFLLKNSYDDSSYADIDMTLDNSSLTVVGTTDNQDSFIIDDQASLTLKNGSSIEDVRDFNILAGADLALAIDSTSSISATNVSVAEDVPLDAAINDNGTVTFTRTLKGTGAEGDPYLINNLEDLKAFRDAVNTYQSDGSNQFKGKYVKLTADIDLEGENWEPIGTNSVGDHMAFLGTFDGDGHTISNLYINSDGGHLGFFARVGSYAEDVTPTVKNLIFENVDVSANVTNHWTTGHGDYVGGVIANAGGNSVISNVKVTGDVYVVGCGYVGGIVGHGYPDIDNCHVIANDGSYVQAGYWCAGGIIGYAGEGGTPITNCSVSGLDIWSAYGAAAAVAGLLQDGNTMTNVSASNVEISSNSDYVMGYIAGNGEASTLTNVTMTNVTATANGNTIAATDMVAQLADKTVYKTIGEAIAAAGSGETITLLSDIALTESLDISKEGTYTIDGNGNTISGGALRFNGTNCDLKDIVFEDCIRGNYAAVEFVNSESTITDCVFRNNAVDVIAIDCDVTKGTGTSEVSIVNCVFENNTSHSASVINHSDGTSCEITNCDFINNTGTLAVVYISDDASVTGCYFSGNTLTGSNENKAAVLAGPYDELDQTTYYEVVINGNAFLDADFPGVWMEDWEETYGAVTTYDISNNYWLDGNSPVKDTDYGVTRDPVATNSSYADKYVRNDSKPGVTVSTYSAPVYIPAALTCKVTVSDTTDGTVKADTSYAAKGQTVTITVDPDKGYVLETLTVLDEDSKEIELTKVSDTKYTFEMPASTVTVEATFMEDNTMLNYFVDVFASDYYYDAVLWAVENGITNGTSATTFSPDAVCTRAQVVTFLWRAAGSPEPRSTDMPFADVAANAYYYDAVLWAVENGITNGTGADTFSPDADCTRAQIVTFLWRSQGCEDAAAYNPFADVESDAYYTEAVLWAVEEAITNGTSATTFSPDADCTRAQIVTFLWRCLNK